MIRIEINTDNAAFSDGYGKWPEILRILSSIEPGDHKLYDVNGNHVGRIWEETEEKTGAETLRDTFRRQTT